MKHFLQKILTCMFVCMTCAFGAIDSAKAATFTVNTSSTSSFQFQLSAQGTFTVDCGTGGTLGSDDSTAAAMISGATINKNDTVNYTFKCTYSGSTSRTIGFDGTATGYNTSTTTAAISFSGRTYITSVSGNLSAIFPYISGNARDGAQPRFFRTFYNCTGLTSVPGTLFKNYPTAATYMFSGTFSGCTGLESIPSDLFSHFTTGATDMFNSTFYGCTGLTSIPSGLFSHITTGAVSMFSSTFYGCTGLTSIPSGLFSNITTGAQNMFYRTFNGCTGLESIPSDLFSSFTTGASNMFRQTFYNCSNLTGYIPPTLFAGLIANNAPTSVFNGTFTGTGMDSSCSSGSEYAQEYTSAWGGKVSCIGAAFSVTYSCGSNGTGTPTDSNSPYADGTTVTALTSSACTASNGYTFNGWSCGNNVGNVSAEGTFTMPAANTTCTAQWAPVHTLTYSCGSNGTGTPTDSNSPYIDGTTVTALTSSACTASSGYMFNGWSCDNSVGSISSGGTFTMPAANTTCTAQWTGNTVTLTWYEDDGTTTLSGGASSCTYGGTITPLPTAPAKPGYHLARWKISVPQCASITDQTTCGNTSGCVYASGYFGSGYSSNVHKCCSIVTSCSAITDAETCENSAQNIYNSYIRCKWTSYGDFSQCEVAQQPGAGN